MCQADLEILEWLDTITDPQVRALAHQTGLPWADSPENLRGKLRECKRFAKVKKILEKNYV